MTEAGGVIVVGAGPVGFITALELAREGVPVTIVEAEDRINDSPRAAVYLPTTLRILDRLGILEDAHDAGVYNTDLQMIVAETGTRCRLNRAEIEGDMHDYAYQLHFGQDVLAKIVERHLLALPDTEVRFNTCLTAITQDGSGVTATVTTPDGEEALCCDWLIGCDGARSGVRRALGLSFDGFTWPDRFVATNIWYDEFEEHGFAPANFYMDPRDWAVIAVIGRNNLWRVTYGEDAEISEEEALRRIPERLGRILPGSGRFELSAASPYRLHERTCETYRVGRALLAGDAAHVCNPCGGLGLTGGIVDADVLTRALSAVIHGDIAEEVLDRYSEERRRVFREFTSPQASEFKRMLSESDPERRRQDEEGVRLTCSDPEVARQAMAVPFRIEGNPIM
jgi:2-polyprenyl-6-methoxyphenol hydroxylase-like FAD-dependent oxidoreductase